jgi:hypothetical protein
LTIQEYVFPIGKSKPIISTPEVKVIWLKTINQIKNI